MNYCKTLAFLLPLYFIWAVSQRSTAAASLIQARQNLGQEGDKSNPKPPEVPFWPFAVLVFIYVYICGWI